jgi:hypothetical protein
MRTEELIARLSADLKPTRGDPVGVWLTAAVLIGGAASAILLLVWLGLRPLGAAVGDAAFWLKAGYAMGLAAAGWTLASRLARPTGRTGAVVYAVASVVGALALLGGAQFIAADPEGRAHVLFGETWTQCPWRILALSSPILLALCLAMRRLAPVRPRAAGLAIGLLAGSVGAAIYGLYCQETSPAFVAAWYSLGIGLTAALGAAVSRRVLSW